MTKYVIIRVLENNKKTVIADFETLNEASDFIMKIVESERHNYFVGFYSK